jgi:O-antigen/teichoic acid export membrane protein
MEAMLRNAIPASGPAVVDTPTQLSSGEKSMLAHHGRWAVIGRSLTLISTFASMAILARILSPSSFAEFNVLRITITLFAVGAASGISQTALRILSHQKSRSESRCVVTRILQTALVFLCIATIAGFAAVYFWGHALLHRDIGLELTLIVTVAIAAFAVSDVVSEVNRGLGTPSIANMVGGTKGSPIANLMLIAMLPVLWYLGKDDSGSAMLITAISVLIAVAAGVVSIVQHLAPSSERTGSVNSAERLTSSEWGATISLTLSALLTFLCSQGDIFLVGCFTAETDEVAYVAARRLIFLLSIPLTMLNTMAFGIIPKLLASGRLPILESTLRTGAALAGLPCLLIAGIMLFFPEWTLWVFLGPGYQDGSTLLQIMIPGQIVLVLSGSCGILLALAGHQRSLLVVNVVMCMFMLAGGYLAATYSGGMGLSIVVSLIIAAHNICTWALAVKLVGVNTWCRFRGLKAAAAQFLATRQTS